MISHALASGADWHFEDPRIRGATTANNLNFAVKWYLDQAVTPVAHCPNITRPAVVKFRADWVIMADPTNLHAVIVRKRAITGRFRADRPIAPPTVVTQHEGQRLSRMGFEVSDLQLFRAVLVCMRHGLITWPVPFNGAPLQIHRDYVTELVPDRVEPVYFDDTDSTVLVPVTDQ